METVQLRRFLCPDKEQFVVDGYGFLVEPVDSKYISQNLNLKTLQDISALNAVGIIGEPGIGKSSFIEDLFKYEKEKYEEGSIFLKFDLKDFDNSNCFVEKVFRCDEIFALRESDSSKKIYLYLDSLDEGTLRIDTLIQRIEAEIVGLGRENFRLRISCRSSMLPSSARDLLKSLSGERKDIGGVYELLPLTIEDIKAFCRERGLLHPEKFINEAIRKDAVNFINRPLLLDFNIGEFKRNGKLPDTRYDLYYLGCRKLCEENRKSLKESRLIQNVDIQEKFSRVCEIAFICIFGDRVYVAKNDEIVKRERTLYLSDINGIIGKLFSRDYLERIIDSGLFSSRGDNLVGWSHKSYFEFMAAYYLVNKKVSLETLVELTMIDISGSIKVIPQLKETAKWIATKHGEYFDYLLENDVKSLLVSDLSSFTDGQKNRVWEKTLNQLKYGEERIDYDMLWGIDWSQFSHIRYETTIDLIDIEDASYEQLKLIREVYSNEKGELPFIEDFFKVVSDQNQESFRRESYLDLLPEKLKTSQIAILKETLNELKTDNYQTLRGAILSKLWPEYLTGKEIYNYLSQSSDRMGYGRYQRFIQNELLRKNKKIDLLSGLKWIPSVYRDNSYYDFNIVISNLIERALSEEGSSDNDVLFELGVIIVKCFKGEASKIKSYSETFILKFNESSLLRMKILELISDYLSENKINFTYLTGDELSLVREDSLEFLFDKYLATKNNYWLVCSRWAFNQSCCAHVLILLKYSRINIEIRKGYFNELEPIELDSDYARSEKSKNINRKRRALKFEKEKNDSFKRKVLISFKTKLIKFKAKQDPQTFNNLLGALFYRFKDGRKDHKGDLKKLDLWNSLNNKEIEYLNDEFTTYFILNAPLFKSNNEDDSVFYVSEIEEAILLFYIFDNHKRRIESINNDILLKWILLLIKIEGFGLQLNTKGFFNYVRSVDGATFEVFVKELLLNKIEERKPLRKYLLLFSLLENESKDELCESLLNIEVRDERLLLDLNSIYDIYKNKVLFSTFYDFLLLPNDIEENRKLIEIAFTEILKYGERYELVKLFRKVWPIKGLCSWFVNNTRTTRFGNVFLKKLKPRDISILYAAIIKLVGKDRFNEAKSIAYEEFSPIENILLFMNSLINELVERGTESSYFEINKICKNNNIDVKIYLEESLKNVRKNKWQPMANGELNKIITSDEKVYFLRSNSELQKLILKALSTIEKESHEKHRPVLEFWNTDSNTPKKEDEISDILAHKLDKELKNYQVFTNREVQLKATLSCIKRSGERSDILVEASSEKTNYEKLCVVVECKGIWNPELKTSLINQLSERYLLNGTKFGIYLVYDTFCAGWSNDDKKKGKAKKNLELDLQSLFSQQVDEMREKGFFVTPMVMNLRMVPAEIELVHED